MGVYLQKLSGDGDPRLIIVNKRWETQPTIIFFGSYAEASPWTSSSTVARF